MGRLFVEIYIGITSGTIGPFSGPSSAQPFKNWPGRRYPLEAFFPDRLWNKDRWNSSFDLAATTHTRHAMAEEDLAQMRISVEMYCRTTFSRCSFAPSVPLDRPISYGTKSSSFLCNDFLAAVISACFVVKPIHCYCCQDQGLRHHS
jgi:hypothetical protein